MNLSLCEAPPELLAIILRQPSSHGSNRLPTTPAMTTVETRSMLAVLNPDMPYDDWIRVGMALHSEGAELALWDDWSGMGTKYKPGECAQKWDSFNGNGKVSGRTLVYMARQAGYQHEKPATSSQTNLNHSPRPLLPLLHWSELGGVPKRSYLIKGLLDRGGMSVAYGPSNSGKSFLALDISCHVALGWKWRGLRVSKGAVVYIAAEGGFGVSERLEAFRRHHRLPEYADVYVIPINVCLGKNEAMTQELLSSIKDITNLKLIVIDTLARAIGSGDENNGSDMGAFIQNCDRVRQECNAHLMIVHHSGKDQTKGARGHSSLKAAIDTEIEVSQVAGIIQATVTKQREGRRDSSFNSGLSPVQVGQDEDGEPVMSCVLLPTSVSSARSKLTDQARGAYQVLLNLLSEHGFDHKPKSGMSPQRCARVDIFREHFTKAGIVRTDNPESVAKAFLRAKNSMKVKGYVAEWDNHIWLTDMSDK